ncbi:maltotransferase domain-containing protein [Vineibacter terrae]|uniref:maltotransferase domain-containing protein n=1 Tax=Vineibacter terrae TaxID=2586908 RepID=UPI001E4DB35E|nr:maltotransferase domain-containing protein [Vineibacter terrae]
MHGLKPRIYYLHPLLAGPLQGWPQHIDRCAQLGFDHLLVAPIFLPGRSGSIFATADHDKCHPALKWSDAADDAVAAIAAMCRDRGLALLLDLVIDKLADDAGLVQAHPDWFSTAADPDAMPPDPRLPQAERFVVHPRAEAWSPGGPLGTWWEGRLRRWIDAGATGFRCESPHRAPADALRTLIAAARHHRQQTLFIAWTPGLARQDQAALAGSGFDLTVASTAWWDYRAEWLLDEDATLRSIAPPLGLAEPPFGTRLAEGCSDAVLLHRRYKRAVMFAAAYGTGWIAPMGIEFASPRRLDCTHDQADDFQALREAPLLDCTADIKAANTLSASTPPVVAPAASQLVSSPRAAVAAVLQSSRADNPGSTRLILANADLGQANRIDAASLLMRSADHGVRYRSLLPPQGEALSPDKETSLAAGEVRLLAAETVTALLSKRRSGRAAVDKACSAPRVVLEQISPAVDGGRFPVKRLIGDLVTVEADIFSDGHGILRAVLRWRHDDESDWREQRMEPVINDRWRAAFPLERLGRYVFTIEAWCDAFATYRDELTKKYAAGRTVDLEIEEGRVLIAQAAQRMSGEAAGALEQIAAAIPGQAPAQQIALLLAEATADLMAQADDRPFKYRHEPALAVEVDRRAAAFASWYEIFPRSQSGDPARHGTFDDVIRNLPRIRAMGFDVLYFPPIHPIGRTNRKGRNNSLQAGPTDPGSPYAIGASEGGHDAIHSELGSIDDFRRLREAAAAHGLELALDFAIQCAPDHPWLKQHPGWFDWRPDGSLRYAENPPKKYEDIVNVDFYTQGAKPGLWLALRDVVLFWADQGVRLFRVDNPHTKPLPFWEWLIADIRARYPDAIFLSEAFTRPKMMYRLAKIGFSQSYTYFTWRNTKHELQEYLTELTTTAPRDFFRPHFFVNTPDINPVFLQTSGRPGFLIRAALATMLSGLWGLYNGFELCEGTPLPGREEYANSEKYELRAWDWDRPGNIVAEVTRLNDIRRRNPALQSHLGIRFYNAFNDNILYFGKATTNRDNTVLVAVNLDPHHAHEADFEVPLWEWSLPDHGTVWAEDLMRGGRTTWTGKVQHMRLDPADLPFAIWRVAPLENT